MRFIGGLRRHVPGMSKGSRDARVPALTIPLCITASSRDPVREDGDVGDHVAVDDQHVGQLAGLERADLVGRPQISAPVRVAHTIVSSGLKPT